MAAVQALMLSWVLVAGPSSEMHPGAGTGVPTDAPWERVAQGDGVTVLARERKGSPVRELKAVGLIQAPPPEVWKAIRDYDNYKKTMPYTQESKVISTEDGGRVTYFYSVVTAPLVSRRDYVIRVVDESRWQDGKGFFKAVWHASDKGPPPRPDIVRVAVVDGYWLLEPKENGKATFATYYVFTDPGGALPKWVANTANGTAVPEVFKAIRKTTHAGK